MAYSGLYTRHPDNLTCCHCIHGILYVKGPQEAKTRLKEKNLTLEMANEKLRQEIDERIRAEMALRESEEKLHDIFENVPDALFFA